MWKFAAGNCFTLVSMKWQIIKSLSTIRTKVGGWGVFLFWLYRSKQVPTGFLEEKKARERNLQAKSCRSQTPLRQPVSLDMWFCLTYQPSLVDCQTKSTYFVPSDVCICHLYFITKKEIEKEKNTGRHFARPSRSFPFLSELQLSERQRQSQFSQVEQSSGWIIHLWKGQSPIQN